MRDDDIDLSAGLPLVTTGAIPAHARQPVTPLQKMLDAYPQMAEDRHATIEPRLRMANDAAYSKALNNLLTTFGYDRRRTSIAVEPEPKPGPKSGALIFTGNPLSWLRRLFRRGE